MELIVKLRETYDGDTWESLRSFADEFELQAYVDGKEGLGAVVKVLRVSHVDHA